MTRAFAIGVVGILMVGAGVGLAQGPSTSTYSFGPHTFSVALPTGFSLASNTGDANFKLLSFSTPPRENGTRGVIQITLWDMPRLGETMTLDQFSAVQVTSLQDSMPDLKQTSSSGELSGVAMRRVEWSATETYGRARVAFAGVILVGINGRIGFSISLRERQPDAARYLPVYEAAMKSFTLRVASEATTAPAPPAPAPAPPAPPAPARQAPPSFTRPVSATSEIPLLDDRVILSFDPSVWRELPVSAGAPRSLQHLQGDVSVTIVSERRQIPMESWPSIVRQNGEKAATDARIAEQEHRRVNGLDVMMIRMEATISGTPYTFLGYYYSSDGGSIQLVTYTRQSAFAGNRNEVEQLLNGLHIKGAVVTDAAAAAVRPSAAPPTSTPPPPAAPSAPVASAAGTLTGKVRFRGTPPAPTEIRMAADPACEKLVGESVNVQRVLVDASGGLQNVFVYVRDGLSPSATFPMPTAPARLDQKGCQYVPRVLGVRVGQPLQIVNSGPSMENPHFLPKVNAEFNIGQPIEGMTTTHTFTKPEVMVPVKDDIHGWKSGFIGVVAHPFFAVTGSDGSFRIDGLPPGSYVVAAWHEVYGTVTQRVTVGGGQSGNLSFEFVGAPGGGAK